MSSLRSQTLLKKGPKFPRTFEENKIKMPRGTNGTLV